MARLQLTSILLNVRPCDADLLRTSVLQNDLNCTCAQTDLITCLRHWVKLSYASLKLRSRFVCHYRAKPL